MTAKPTRQYSFYKAIVLGGVFAMLVTTAQADIRYTVEAKPDAGQLHVTMVVPHTGDHGCTLQIPAWGPGGYRLNDNYTHVKNLVATDSSGKSLKIDQSIITHPKPYENAAGEWKVADNKVCTWSVAPASDTTIQYDVPSPLTDGSMHWGGPATYMYEVSRLREKCVLNINVPKGWPVYTGLVETKPGSHEYRAKWYDELADNPVSTGDLTVDTYESRGKMHYIVMRNPQRKNVDRPKLTKACKFISDMETDFFGDSAPYDHYVWHFAVTSAADGGGGLEHLASTEITLAQGVGPVTVDVMAHEFFHLWNVKRIRSKVLGPFDYTKLPDTGALWWLEGVTDYYAYTLLHRYGWTTDPTYFSTIASNFQTVRRNTAYKEIGPNESSMRVAEDSNGRGNSNGYHISYYNLGWLAGMCLDIELRSQTGSKHTLDDVEHALWQLCKDDKPGFGEDEIRKQLVKFGGMSVGLAYDRIVMWPGAMNLEATLNKAGLAIAQEQETYGNPGFASLGGGFGGGFGGPGGGAPPAVTVTSVTPNGAASGILQVDDEILSVNGSDGENGRGLRLALNRAIAQAKPGQVIKLTISRNGKTKDVEVVPASATRPIWVVRKLANPTPEQKQLGEAWLAQIKFKP